MTNTTLNLGDDYVTFNYAAGREVVQLQSNKGREFKPLSFEDLDTMITWLVGVRQNMEKAHKEAVE